jgi:hypothetical protein
VIAKRYQLSGATDAVHYIERGILHKSSYTIECLQRVTALTLPEAQLAIRRFIAKRMKKFNSRSELICSRSLCIRSRLGDHFRIATFFVSLGIVVLYYGILLRWFWDMMPNG